MNGLNDAMRQSAVDPRAAPPRAGDRTGPAPTGTDVAVRPRFVAFPRRLIDYTLRLYAALEAEGATVAEGTFSGGWIRAHVRRGDVAHFHWPSFEYHRATRAATSVAFLRWVALLLLLRVRGARIVWTAHNLLPPDRATVPWLDVMARHVIIGMSEKVFVHGPRAAAILAARFPAAAGKVVLIPHGHFIDHFAAPLPREQMRRQLGLAATTFTFLAIGTCKPYKNIDGLIEAFAQIEGDAALVVAGKFSDAAYEERVRQLAARDARVRLLPGFIPDDDLGSYVVACDVVVAAYRDILTSGTALLAMSFGRPLVSVARGHLLDTVTEESGVLYDPDRPEDLVTALRTARARRFPEDRIVAHARTFGFDDAARRTLRALGFATILSDQEP